MKYMYDQMIQELGEIPYCQCDCGNKVDVHPDRIGSYTQYKRTLYPKFINFHNSKTPEFKEQVSEQMSKEGNFMFGKPDELSPLRKIPRTIEDLIKIFGEIPFCKCDCGNKVFVDPEYHYKYKKQGYPQYILGHHARVNNPMDIPELMSTFINLELYTNYYLALIINTFKVIIFMNNNNIKIIKFNEYVQIMEENE